MSSLVFTAARDPVPTYIQLVLVGVATILSFLSTILDAFTPSPNRLITHGGETTPSPSDPSSGHYRRLCWSVFFRLILALSIAASLAPALYLAFSYFTSPSLSSLTDPPTAKWLHSLMRLSVRQYVENTGRSELRDVSVGVGKQILTPGDSLVRQKIAWACFMVAILVFICIGLFLSIGAHVVPARNIIAAAIFVQAAVWLLGSLGAAFIHPTRLPLDSSPLQAKWLDREYAISLNNINEDRFLSNWFIDYSNKSGNDVTPVADLPGFSSAFCLQFKRQVPLVTDDSPQTPPSVGSDAPTAAPTSPPPSPAPSTQSPPSTATESEPEPEPEPESESELPTVANPPLDPDDPENDRPSVRIPTLLNGHPQTRQTATSWSKERGGEVLIVYTVGKPIGTDHFRAVAYLALGAMVGGPVAAAHMFHSYFLYPFLAVWIALIFLFMLLATPSVLRSIRAPVEGNDIITFCNQDFIIDVVDNVTRRIAKLDVIIFVLIFVTAVLQGYRWLRIAERSKIVADAK